MVLIEVAGTIFISFVLLFKIRAADTHFNLFYSFGWFLINFFTFPVFFFFSIFKKDNYKRFVYTERESTFFIL